MNLPSFLIIGAMKSGTTTLYRDLQSNARIFMPENKEPEALIHDDVLTDQGRSRYAALFRRAEPHHVCGEASTAYTKRPTYEGVPQRALAVLGRGLKVIYIVRDPVSRAISHHRHLSGLNVLPHDFDKALRGDTTLMDYGCYAMQIEPWIKTFGHEQVRVVCFERYVRDREAAIDHLCEFLGVDAESHEVDTARVYNRSEGKPQMVGIWRVVRGNFLYDRILRPFLPPAIRERLRLALLPREKTPPSPLSASAVDRMVEIFAEETARLQKLLGLDEPFWDFEAIRAAHTDGGRATDGG